jgi:hypothetical protein
MALHGPHNRSDRGSVVIHLKVMSVALDTVRPSVAWPVEDLNRTGVVKNLIQADISRIDPAWRSLLASLAKLTQLAGKYSSVRRITTAK